MSVDFSPCEHCGEVFCEVGRHYRCEDCGAKFCSLECLKAAGGDKAEDRTVLCGDCKAEDAETDDGGGED